MGFPPAPNIHTYICKKETHLSVRPPACKMLTNKMERSLCPRSTGTGSGTADSSNSQGTWLTRALRTLPAFSVNSRPLLRFERASKAQHSSPSGAILDAERPSGKRPNGFSLTPGPSPPGKARLPQHRLCCKAKIKQKKKPQNNQKWVSWEICTSS